MPSKGRRVPVRFNRVAVRAFNSFGNDPGHRIVAPHRYVPAALRSARNR
jgi:hypothetical protein